MKTKRWAKDRAVVRLRSVDKSNWPDPPMVPSHALRRCEQAGTVEEVRAVVHQYLPRMVNK